MCLIINITTKHCHAHRIPKLTLENAKGISNDKVKTFKKELDSRAKKLRGEVSILDSSLKGQSEHK